MENSITIQYPESLAFSLKMENEEFQSEMKKLSLVKLYEMGKVSSGFAANLLNMSRVDFLDLLAKYQVSYFGSVSESELESDIANA